MPYVWFIPDEEGDVGEQVRDRLQQDSVVLWPGSVNLVSNFMNKQLAHNEE